MTRREYAGYVRNQPSDADRGDQDDDIEAILREDDHLPDPRTRQQAARDAYAAHGQDHDGYGEDPDAASYADIDAILAGEDGLPTPAESRAATWGDHPVFYDETDLADEDAASNADEPALDQTRTWTLTPQASHDTARREHPSPDTGKPDESTDAFGQSVEDSEAWRQRVADLEAENAELGKAVGELETENSQLGKTVAALEARLERLEQRDPESRAGDVDIDNRTRRGVDEEPARPRHEQKRWPPSDEALLFGAAGIGGAVTTASYYLGCIRPDVAGITASMLAAGAAGVAWIHKRREARHADRSED